MVTESGGTVYVLSKGDYSDYQVLCALTTKKAADALAGRVNAIAPDYVDPVRVEELMVVDQDAQRVSILRMVTTIYDDGTETVNPPSTHVEWPFDSIFPTVPVHWRWVRAPMHNGKGGRLEVTGTDHERVRKVFGEKRALLHSDDAFRARKEATR